MNIHETIQLKFRGCKTNFLVLGYYDTIKENDLFIPLNHFYPFIYSTMSDSEYHKKINNFSLDELKRRAKELYQTMCNGDKVSGHTGRLYLRPISKF